MVRVRVRVRVRVTVRVMVKVKVRVRVRVRVRVTVRVTGRVTAKVDILCPRSQINSIINLRDSVTYFREPGLFREADTMLSL